MGSLARRRMLAAFTALLLFPASAALAGCNSDQVGAAVIIDREAVTIEELQKLTKDYLRVMPGADKAAAQRDILNATIQSHVFATAARKSGVSTTAGEVARVRDEIFGQVGGRKNLVKILTEPPQTTGLMPEAVPPSKIEQWVRIRILESKIVEKVSAGGDPRDPAVQQRVNRVFVAAAKSLGVEMNPRYGTWDPRRRQLRPQVGGGLSRSLTEIEKAAKRT